jgi:lipid-binding SYLF domain-containing protein
MRTLPLILLLTVAGAGIGASEPDPARSLSQTGQELSGDLKDAAERSRKATEVFNELVTAPDRGIPTDLLSAAEAIIVIPSLMKGGFIVGAKHGKGLVSVRRPPDVSAGARSPQSDAPPAAAWSGPAFVKITGGTIGWQIGLESVDLVLLVMNRKGVEELLEDRFTIGGSLSLAAGQVGRSGNAATNITAETGILGYSRAQGLFAGATLEGAGIRNDRDENEAVYGGNSQLRTILITGAKPIVPLPVELQQWQSTIARAAARR